MSRHPRWLPTKEQLLNSRWLKPVAHHLHDEKLWHMNRQSVARAAAIGLFFGLMLPFAQFLFAVVVAIVFRAHVALSAAFTLVTNPFTFPPIYWLAHRIGTWVLNHAGNGAAAEQAHRQVEQLGERLGWFDATWQWLQSAGAPLLLGLGILACTAAVLGYALVWLLWRPRHRHGASGGADSSGHSDGGHSRH